MWQTDADTNISDCAERIMESIGYALYMHRQELGRPRRCRRLMRIASTKLRLTNELIWLERCQWQLEEPDYQQWSALNREREYRDILEHNMQQQQLKQQQLRQRQLDRRRHETCQNTARPV
ncbi:uncharacterized protein [Drosophila virilis]|uniref:Uncharacterized protein n=1 Tax=Drosophila virilis TaxID=7244 RepID=B4MFZ8_DROVI|nr:uncharacterized protein LOC6636544 [Drosophila virilis]XP_032291459.1 uncharacterized protein LOC116650818 [Drosophila virilis]XP_032291515.1 uncharacterized protein LOC116650835 [Drosophila virilis]EDW58259.2 uncharacterized protein Dvir_GJ15478 [Drosophila virilis]